MALVRELGQCSMFALGPFKYIAGARSGDERATLFLDFLKLA